MARKIWSMDKPQPPRPQSGRRSLRCKLFVNSVLAGLTVGLLAIKFLCTTSKIGAAMIMATKKIQPALLQKIATPKSIIFAARVVWYSILTGVIGTGLVLSVYSFPWILVPVSAGLLLYNRLPSSRGNFKPTARPALLPTTLPTRVPCKIRGNIRPSISSSQRKMPVIGKQDVLQLGWQAPDEWYAPVQDTSSPLTKTELENYQPTTMLDYSRLDLSSRGHVERQYCR